MKTLYKYLDETAKAALKLQGQDGSMPAGHNGPYFDEETPVRNTGHWLITFLKAYEISGDKKFFDSAYKAVNYLLSRECRPMDAVFWHRKNPEKDFSNGLIGQAWSIEALSAAAGCFEMPEILETAGRVYLLHPLDEKTGLWRRVGVDGSFLAVDGTFNHQLWFAAAGALINKYLDDGEIGRRAGIFMDRILDNLELYPSGLIVHHVKPGISSKLRRAYYSYRVKNQRIKQETVSKAAGYHLFNLYAFSLLKICFPEHSFWKSGIFNRLWAYANSAEYEKALFDSEFGYPYNPPGFEMAFAMEVFERSSGKREKQEKWVSGQMRMCFDSNSKLMEKNTKDRNTAVARIYEATRLPDIRINL